MARLIIAKRFRGRIVALEHSDVVPLGVARVALAVLAAHGATEDDPTTRGEGDLVLHLALRSGQRVSDWICVPARHAAAALVTLGMTCAQARVCLDDGYACAQLAAQHGQRAVPDRWATTA